MQEIASFTSYVHIPCAVDMFAADPEQLLLIKIEDHDTARSRSLSAENWRNALTRS
jgi:hypothetical protein